MKIGVFTSLFNDRNLEDTLDYIAGTGAEMVEFYCGPLYKSNHCDPDELLKSNIKLANLKETVARHNLSISMVNCSGNPIHPVKEIAEKHHHAFEKTVLLAEQLGIDRVGVFSGCPGGSPGDKSINWVTCPWPEEYLKILEYQWNEVLAPYWEKAVAFAGNHGVTKIAFEMHPGFCIYNPETLLKLRGMIGKEIGANFDPSHLFWQGINPSQAIMALGEAIYHVHMKDTQLNKINIGKYGVLDTKHYSQVKDRAWVFRTVGYGHDYNIWKEVVSSLSMVNYDYVLSIEHEDSLMSKEEGLNKAISFLKEIVIRGKNEQMWWA
jgi:Sugar phosphate isomerases/epimerases